MKEQLQLLMRLQEIDAQIDQHEAVLTKFPQEIQEMARNLVSLRHEMSETQEGISANEKDLLKREDELNIEQEKIKRSERRLLNIKNLKEHEALSREIKLGKKVAGEIEDSVLEIINNLEQMKKNLERKQAEYEECEKSLIEKKTTSEKMVKESTKALKSLKLEQSELAEGVDTDCLKRYSMVRKVRGKAIAEMINGSCDGCHIAIPPQLGITVMRQQEFVFCPNCHRILYVKEENIPSPNGGN